MISLLTRINSHGRRASYCVAVMVLGSVAHKVMHAADCRVVVVK
jgi:nucleotide-binding universal stress UspA family protein